jgi:hypothetical protein
MFLTRKTARPRLLDRFLPALITGIGLCVANFGMDFAIDRLGTSASKTILNDIVIGLLGALAVSFYLSAGYEKQNFDSAKERILLIKELNQRIREVIGLMANSAMSEDRCARLRGIDDATDRIDDILSDFTPHQRSSSPPRLDRLRQKCVRDNPSSAD